jgi:hypothetical protein
MTTITLAQVAADESAFHRAHLYLTVYPTKTSIAVLCSCGHWGPVIIAAKQTSSLWRARVEPEQAEWEHFLHKTGWTLNR